jgi:hypothetical protein
MQYIQVGILSPPPVKASKKKQFLYLGTAEYQKRNPTDEFGCPSNVVHILFPSSRREVS